MYRNTEPIVIEYFNWKFMYHEASLIIFILNLFSKQVTHFKAGMHELESAEPHAKFCSDQWAYIEWNIFIILIVYMGLSYPSANVT